MNPFRFLRSSKAKSTAPIAASSRARRTRLRVEELEPREVPTSDIFTVTGAAGAQVTVNFAFKAHDAVFWDEIGVYTINDDQGRVGNFLPGDAGYAKAALDTAQTVFMAGDFEGAAKTLTFTAGTRLAFYLIQNNTLDAWKAHNPQNRAITGLQAFFSIDGVNRDHFDHLHTTKFGDRSMRLNWEDGSNGGDRDFNDDVINVSISGQETSQVPGVAGQNISTRFQFLSKAVFQNEFGFFMVDDVTGKIGTLNPGDAGYAAAALDASRRTIVFRQRSQPVAVRNINMPGGAFFGLYLIQNGNSVSFLKHNPNNKLTGGPVAFFSFTAANPDNFKHVKWLSPNMFAWEDTTQGTTGADRDYRDFVGTITFRKPGNTAPFVVNPIANITNATANTPNKVIDLAGVFDDRDLANSRVRFNTNFGAIDMVLFDRAARQTVANFYDYITDGKYNNTIFHRSAKSGGLPFVLQGGGFAFNDNGPNPTTLDPITNANTPTVPNEPDFVNRSNVRGTIAMAKGSNANSATSQFFFNLNDNSAALNNTSNSGGFTVFGQVLNATTQHAIDVAAAVPTQAHASPFNEIPLKNYTFKNPDTFPGDTVRDNYLIVNSVAVLSRPEFLSYTAVSSDPTAVSVSVVHEQMTLHFIHGTQSPVTITVTATDSVGHHTTTRFQVSVANRAPVSSDDAYTGNQDAPLNVNAGAGVLANDTDPDGNTLTAIKVTDPTHGTVILNSDGSFIYTPNAGFHGADTFTYKANDGQLNGNTATVTITVNAPPTAVADSNATDQNTLASGNVLTNDTDPDAGDTLTVSAVNGSAANVGTQITLASGALLTVNANGTYSYDPNGSFASLPQGQSATDSFTYTISDGHGGTSSATVTITVNGLNDPPSAAPDANTTDENTPVGGNVLSNDTDPDAGDALTVAAVNGNAGNVGTQITLASGALLTVNANGTYSYDPNGAFSALNPSESATDSFTYVVADSLNATSTATVTITINGA
jgi:VCBS repeat-containing protein